MLNQEDGESNILLAREVRRKKVYETQRIDTSGNNWMAPFADHLGISSNEFVHLKPLFSSERSKVLLVEGEIDQQYFNCLKYLSLNCAPLAADIEVVPYGGKDTLKNTLLIQFVLGKFDRVYVTCDLDALQDVRSALERANLQETTDYTALGINKPGQDCIEGLLPKQVIASVNGKETDLVMQLSSKDNSTRRGAKDALKRKYLEAFKAANHEPGDLRELEKVVTLINGKLG